MSKSRIIVNADYVNEHAATYGELRDWLDSVSVGCMALPIMLGTPDGKVWAIRKPVDKSANGFIGEAIEVEVEVEDA